MFNLEALDKLIAVVVTLLVLSLIVQSIQSAIKNFFRIKSLQLEQSLIHLFYYILNKDAIKAMRSVADRAPLLRAFFGAPIIRKFIPDQSKGLLTNDPQVEALYHAVTEEFVRAGRVSPGGKMLIRDVSKDELIRFIGQVRVSELIKDLPPPERQNISEIKAEIAGALNAVKQLFLEHPELLEQASLAKVREPLLELLSNADQFLDMNNSDLTLGDLTASVINSARKTLEATPDSIQLTLLHLKDEASVEAAEALRKLQEGLAPLWDKMRPLVALPQKLGQILGKVEIWYDTIMRSFDERYTRSMKTFSLVISFVVVALLNANPFDIYRGISADESKRDFIIQAGQQMASRLSQQPPADSQQINRTLEDWSKKSYDEIEKDASLYAALGFSGPRWIVDVWKNPQRPTAQKVVETVAGWLIMTMLLSVGAPFWEDVLESLFGLKNFLRKKDPGAS